jgi:hypothetical protein
MLESEILLLVYLLSGSLIGVVLIFIYYKIALFSNKDSQYSKN